MPVVCIARSRMFLAALMSALSLLPQVTQWKTAWLSRFSFATWPQRLQVWDVYAGLTSMSRVPARRVLYSSLSWMSVQRLPRILRFNPALDAEPLRR